ncbi:MAG: O-antigen ligase family protein [Bacteroidota bacterium]
MYYIDYTKTRQVVSILFAGVIVAFIAEKGVGSLLSFSSLNLAESLVSSRFQSESGLAFLIGLFTFYFLSTKKWGLFSVSLFFVLISGKRTVLAGVAVCLIIYFILAVFRINVRRHRVTLSILALLVNALLIYFIYLLVNGTFDHIIVENTGLPPNSFTKGRYNLWKIIISAYDLGYLGSGLGSISYLLVDQLNYPLHNPLNDVLKIAVEHGFFVFSLWIFTYYFLNSYHRHALVITIYSNILFLTTNVIIYFFFMFCVYFIHSALITENITSLKRGKRKKLIKQVV